MNTHNSYPGVPYRQMKIFLFVLTLSRFTNNIIVKVLIRNFGPIGEVEFDLDKDLHLIYGKNAIGKSYATYCLYCLLKHLRGWDRYLYSDKSLVLFSRIRPAVDFGALFNLKEIRSRKPSDYDITETFKTLIADEIRAGLLSGFQNSLQNTFSSIPNLKNGFSRKTFEVQLNLGAASPFCKTITIFVDSKSELDLKIDFGFESLEYVEKKTKTTRHSIYKDGIKLYGKPTEKTLLLELKSFYFQVIRGVINEFESSVNDVYFLPASRSGLYQGLSSFAPIIAELTQSRFFISNRKIELPTLSEPVSDYYIDLSTVDKKHTNREFENLTQLLEKEILRGKVDFDDDTKNITYSPEGLRIDLNLSEASSMVAELTPLVLYLRHIINHKFGANNQSRHSRLPNRLKKVKNILFIEEPEAHLHPDVQVELMAIFTRLMRFAKVFITSHSNYMFHSLNNTILADEIDTEKIAVYHLVSSKKGTYQKNDMVVTKEGIDDENFQETSEKLYDERLRLLVVGADA